MLSSASEAYPKSGKRELFLSAPITASVRRTTQNADVKILQMPSHYEEPSGGAPNNARAAVALVNAAPEHGRRLFHLPHTS